MAPNSEIEGDVWHLMTRLRATTRVIDGTTAPNDDWAKKPIGWWHPTARHTHEMGSQVGEREYRI